MTRSTVAVNLLWLVPGRVGGSEEATTTSLRALADLAPPDLAVELFVLAPFADAHPDLVAAFPTHVVPLSGRFRAVRVLGEATWLARQTRGFDLVHHAGGTAPAGVRPPYVLTLHDLQPLEHTATHSARKRAYLGLVVPRSLRRARLVLVPSEFVRATILAHSGLTADRVVVLPHGVGRHPDPTPAAELVARYELDGPVVLYPAITYPHKNHATLVAAFAQVLAGHPDALLVLTGRPDTSEQAVIDQIAGLGIGPRVRRLGRIPAADLAGLYDLATVVAVPSRYEGFGLPAAEAMAHAAPVVAATGSALPEVVGEAGVLVDPDDVPAWATAIGHLLEDPAERARLGAAGRERVASLSGPANGAALADAYRTALRPSSD